MLVLGGAVVAAVPLRRCLAAVAIGATYGAFLQFGLDRRPREGSRDHLADIPPLVAQMVEFEDYGVGLSAVHAWMHGFEGQQPGLVGRIHPTSGHPYSFEVGGPITPVPVSFVFDETTQAPELTFVCA